MTEDQWLRCADPQPMLEFMRGKLSERKLRLFICACCYRLWDLIVDERSQRAVLLAEAFADRHAVTMQERNDFALTWCASRDAHLQLRQDFPRSAKTAAARAAFCCCQMNSWEGAYLGAEAASAALARRTALGARTRAKRKEELTAAKVSARRVCAVLLSDLIGNPFHPVSIAPRNMSRSVATLAQSIYEDRAFDRLPLLGDLLEGAGCEDPVIVGHCRSTLPHVRGCWCLDLVLNKQ